MKSVNKCIFVGNVTKAVELKYTPSGTAVAKFSIACNDRYKKNNEWVDTCEFINITAWARQAEVAGEYLHKGDQVYIEGRLKTDSWDSKDTGKKQYSTFVVVTDMLLLKGRKAVAIDLANVRSNQNDDGMDQRPPAAQQRPSQPTYRNKPTEQPQQPQRSNRHEITDDDIPF